MRLSRLLKEIQHARIQMPQGAGETEIESIVYNSQNAGENSLFVCLCGKKTDGHEYIQEACEKGAVCVIVEKLVCDGKVLKMPEQTAVILVKDTRQALARLSAVWFHEPAKHLKVIGITGTKGKSTVAEMVYHMLRESGKKAGLIGTIENILGDEIAYSGNTTPESFTIQEYFDRMVKAGCEYAVMEVSSQGIMQHRIDGICFEIGVFTNFGEDHVGPGEHSSLGEYRYYKSLLFDQCRIGIGNLDDLQCGYMFQRKKCIKYGFTCEKQGWYERMQKGMLSFGKSHVLYAEEICQQRENECEGTSFWIDGTRYELVMPGIFNVYNALAALQTMECLGFDIREVGKLLAHITVKGRTERIAVEEGICCYIDYAHNAMSLRELLGMLRSYRPKRLVVIFGCGGNRAKSRRYEMGEVAGELADFTILTSDNPRDEEPQEIIDDIIAGMEKKSESYKVITDREKAIAYAIAEAMPGDMIVIAGKGHEDYQEIRGERIHMDDRELVQNAIEIRKRQQSEKEQAECTQI